MVSSSSKNVLRLLRLIVVLVGGSLFLNHAIAAPAVAQTTVEATARKLKFSSPPDYPELARKMNIQGVARVLLTVSPDGRVVSVKELGGNPVLVASLAKAVKKWKYEAADHESEVEVKFEFNRNR